MRTFKTNVTLYERLSDLSILWLPHLQVLSDKPPCPAKRLSLEALLPSQHQIVTENRDIVCLAELVVLVMELLDLFVMRKTYPLALSLLAPRC